jgi:hypothetical protein
LVPYPKGRTQIGVFEDTVVKGVLRLKREVNRRIEKVSE